MPDGSVVALDVGGTSIKGWLVDADGRTSEQIERPTPVADGAAAVVAAVRDAAGALAARGADGRVPAAVGVVVPGVVDVAAGVARYSTNLRWRDVPLRELLTADFAVPVALGHDVQAAGLAEYVVGQARDVQNCLVVTIGTGIAGVLITDGHVVRGATGTAGEIGHTPVYPDGELCACGQRGCLEAYASAAALVRRYQGAGGREVDSAQQLAGALEHDPIAARVWQEGVDALGIALASATMLFDPQLVVLGGGLAESGDALLVPVRAALATRLVWRPAPAVLASRFAARAGRIGAAILAWRAAGLADFAHWSDLLDGPA